MRILITGATSDTGWLLTQRLIEQGHHPVCFVRSGGAGLPDSVERIRGMLPEPGAPWGESGEAFDRVAAGCSLAYHIAHIRHAPAVVERAKAAGVVRTVCLSSARRFTRWPDAAAKMVIRAEGELTQLHGGWTILRATMIYGGGNDKNIAKLIRLVERWPLVPLPGGGRHRIQPLLVDDLVEALLTAGHGSQVGEKIIDVAGPEPITVRQAVREIAQALGIKRGILPLPLSPAVLVARLFGASLRDRLRRLGEDRTLDIAAARSLLEFAPKPFAEGVKLLLQRREGEKPEDWIDH